jgi:hypothetical protein
MISCEKNNSNNYNKRFFYEKKIYIYKYCIDITLNLPFRKFQFKKKMSNSALSTSIETYISKLKTAFNLILNDIPDNKDDTISTKLIDSLKRDLSSSNEAASKQLSDFVKSFIENDLLNEELDYSKSSLANKDNEVVTFFLDLINCYIQVEFGQSLKNKLIKFLQSFLNEHSNLDDVDSCILCSLFDLIYIIHDQSINESLFSEKNLNLFLNNNYKSIFVRKSYKSVLKKHIIDLIKRSISGQSDEENLAKHLDLISSTFSTMSIEIKANNLDIYSDVLSYFLFSNSENNDNATTKMLKELIKFHSSFSLEKNQYLINLDYLNNDYIIESFAFNTCFNSLFSFFNQSNLIELADEFKQMNNNVIFYQVFLKALNKILNYSITLSHSTENSDLTTWKNLDIKTKQSINFLFKFQVYFFSFVDQFETKYLETPILRLFSNLFELNDPILISNQIKALKHKILQLATLQFRSNLNKSTQDVIFYNHSFVSEFEKQHNIIDNTENYLLLINNQTIQFKYALLKQCASNLKLFLIKFKSEKFDLFDLISLDQLIYFMRHIELDLNTKNLILSIFYDYFNDKHNLDETYMKNLIDNVFIDCLSIKINESYNENLFKLASNCIINVESFNAEKLIQLILMNEMKNEEIEKLMNFFTSILDKTQQLKPAAFKFIIDLINHDECYLLKKLASLIKIEDDTLYDLKDSIFNFFRSLFNCINKFVIFDAFEEEFNIIESNEQISLYYFENVIFTREFLSFLECIYLTETEAFLRREIIQFLKSYHLYSFKLWLIYLSKHLQSNISASLSSNVNTYIWNFINFFSYILINEFDWQIQLYSIELFQVLFELIFHFLDKYELNENLYLTDDSSSKQFSKLNFIEIICCLSDFFKSIIKSLSDFDQYVITQSASLLFNLKSNNKFIDILTRYDKKHNQLFQNDIKSRYIHDLKMKLKKDGKLICVGAQLEDAYDNDENLPIKKLREDDIEDDVNYLKKFLDSINLIDLKQKINDLNNDSYLYKNNPINILDDIISSYQFEIDDEKAVDCY